MAQRRIPSLTHQQCIVEELEILEEAQDVLKPLTQDIECWGMSAVIPTLNDTNSLAYTSSYQRQYDMRNSLNTTANTVSQQGLERSTSVKEPNDAWDMSSASYDSAMLSKQTVGSCSSMESSEPLILDNTNVGDNSTTCSYSNGGIQMNILVCDNSNDAVADSSDKRVQAPAHLLLNRNKDFTNSNSTNSATQTPFVSSSAVHSAGTKHSTADTRSPRLTNRSSPSTSKTAGYSNSPHKRLTSLDAVRNRHKFANTRSVSTEVPLTDRRDISGCITDYPSLSKLGSISGPLLRVNSFERSTQTLPFNRLSIDHKTHARYESAISDIGVEYMKATGVIATKFKQLQKPNLQSHDSLTGSSKYLNYDLTSDAGVITEKTSASPLCGEVPTVVHMSGVTTVNHKSNHVIKLDSDEEDEPQNKRHTIGYRLGRRKFLAEKRRKIADMCCIFALLGLVLMIVETECNIASVYAKDDASSYIIKSLISTTTIILLCLICIYHAVEVKLFVVDNCIEDWRIAMSWIRVFQIGSELFLCLIHPIPIPYSFNWTILDIKSLEYRTATVPIDILLSLPMFSRLYLIVRVMLLHSKLFSDASSRSIGALNKITFNTRFVLKTLMTIFPGTVMGVFMLSLWIICAWTFRACESYHDPLFANFLNTLYMIAITFLSVGYGDFVPHTHCGRAISVVSGLMGAGCTALVVAVIARKLELTRAEKHVHNFMLETQLNKKLRNTAANVLRETWLIHKYTKLVRGPINVRKVRAHQRKFLQAIQLLRLVKLKQRKLNDQASSLTDFAKTTSQVHDIVAELRAAQQSSNTRIANIEHTLEHLQMQVQALPHSIAQAMVDRHVSTSSFISATDVTPHPSPASRRHKTEANVA